MKTTKKVTTKKTETKKKPEAKVEAPKAKALKPRQEFKKFFARIRKKLSIPKEQEEVIWTHFKAAGFAEKSKFEDGIKHFGYKL